MTGMVGEQSEALKGKQGRMRCFMQEVLFTSCLGNGIFDLVIFNEGKIKLLLIDQSDVPLWQKRYLLEFGPIRRKFE